VSVSVLFVIKLCVRKNWKITALQDYVYCLLFDRNFPLPCFISYPFPLSSTDFHYKLLHYYFFFVLNLVRKISDDYQYLYTSNF